MIMAGSYGAMPDEKKMMAMEAIEKDGESK